MKKVYEWENKTWPEFDKVQVARSDAQKYLKKFSRHFKIEMPRIDMSRRNKSKGTYSYGWIAIPYTCSLGLIVHEFAHHLTRKTYGSNQNHNKKFKRCLKRVYTFAKRYLNKPL